MTRIYYLDDFTDEIMPVSGSLQSWADWLSVADEDWERPPASDGTTYSASAIDFCDDIIATRTDGGWLFSRDPRDDEFLAVRYGPGLGWSSDSIIDRDISYDWTKARWLAQKSKKAALLDFFDERDGGCDDVEYVACGKHVHRLIVTYHARPKPHCTVDVSQ